MKKDKRKVKRRSDQRSLRLDGAGDVGSENGEVLSMTA